MVNTFKKMWSALAVTLVAASSFVAASTNGVFYDGVGGPCPCPCPCGPNFDNNCCESNADWSFSAEALIWRACEDGLIYGTQTTVTPSTVSSTPAFVRSRLKTPHFKWDVGFRLGLSYNLPCDCWGVQVYWTHFRSHHRSRHREGFVPVTPGATASFFTPAWGFAGYNVGTTITTGIDATIAHWKMNLDMLDVELGREFCVSSCLSLRPHIGVRAVWLHQRYNIENFSTTSTGAEVELQNVRLKSDFEGAGLRGGLDSEWNLGCGMSLYGSAAASVVYGNVDSRSRDLYRPTSTTPFFTTDVEQKHNFCACRAITDAAIGLRWNTTLCDCMNLTLQVGWEHHFFFNMNSFEDFSHLSATDSTYDPVIGDQKNPAFDRGNKCLKGVTFTARLDF